MSSTTTRIDWTDLAAAASALAGNWRRWPSFAWSRQYDLDDPETWLVWYTTHRDSGLLDQSNEWAINDRLRQYTEGDDSDVVFERHSHFAVGYLDGFSLRVYRPDGSTTEAFAAFCELQERLAGYPILDEADYSEREYKVTLQNYRSEIGPLRGRLVDGWECEVYQHFSDSAQDRYTENRDDQGGFAPREALLEALKELGLFAEDEE